MIMFSTVSTGFYAASTVNRRVMILESVIRLLQQINSDISYGAEPLHIIMRKACNSNDFANLSFLNCFADSEGEDITYLWKKSVTEFCNNSSFTKDDAALLISFGEKLGSSDSEHQKTLCEEYISQFRERYELLKKSSRDKIRIYKVVSVLVGMVILILLM